MTEENGGKKPEEEIEFIREDEPGEDAPPEAREVKPAASGKEPPAKEASSESSRSLKEKLKKKEAELKHLRKEMDEVKDQFLRKLADLENLRKRFEREKGEFQQFVLSGLLLELLAIKEEPAQDELLELALFPFEALAEVLEVGELSQELVLDLVHLFP
ncbi:MAG: nucleotide exchange factor GrpE, partial [Candidatus Aminicenantes bacterium]